MGSEFEELGVKVRELAEVAARRPEAGREQQRAEAGQQRRLAEVLDTLRGDGR